MSGMKMTTISSIFDVPKGERFLDKLILFLLRITYFGVRLSLRLVIGKKLRDKFFVRHGLDFPTFTYKLLRKIGLDKVLLLLIDMPKQGYKFFCRINRDDFLFMTNHENEIMKYFSPNEGDTVVDIGAHIGLYSLIAAKRVGPSGKVIAIEPDPENFKILKKNNVQRVNYLKIDVEGAELEVLKGAVNTLSSNKNITLVVEIHGMEIYIEMIEYLKAHNLRIIYEQSNELGNWRHIIAKKPGS
jgi:hypothetical protein